MIYAHGFGKRMTDIDPSTVKATEAYRQNGHCKMNNLICTEGDCRHCNFVVDGSIMIALDMIQHELARIRANMGDGDCGCGCGEDCGCH